MDGLYGDAEFLCTDDEVGVGGGAKGIANDKEGDVDVLCICEDGVRVRLDHLAVCHRDRLAVEYFLYS